MWHQRVNIFGGACVLLGNRRLKTTAKGVWERGYWSIMVLMPIRFTAPQLLMNVFKMQWIFYSWRHTKPISVRNRSGYIRTAVWHKCALSTHRLQISLSNSNFWKAQSNCTGSTPIRMHLNIASVQCTSCAETCITILGVRPYTWQDMLGTWEWAR